MLSKDVTGIISKLADEYNRDTNQFYSWKDNRPLPDEPVHSKAPGAVEKNFDEGKNKDTNHLPHRPTYLCNLVMPPRSTDNHCSEDSRPYEANHHAALLRSHGRYHCARPFQCQKKWKESE